MVKCDYACQQLMDINEAVTRYHLEKPCNGSPNWRKLLIARLRDLADDLENPDCPMPHHGPFERTL